jgi:signal peptidase I
MSKTEKRSTVVACLLAIWHPGLGLLYVGRPWLSLLIPFAPFALMLIARISRVALLPWGLSGLCASLIFGWLAIVVWCGFAARQLGQVVLARYQRWYIYVCYGILVSALYLFISASSLDWLGARTYRIPSAAMSDTLLTGDYVVADSWAYLRAKMPERGDVVVFSFPARPGARFAKRVIGLPGERLEGRGDRVYVDGRSLDEPYLNSNYNRASAVNWSYTVPEDSYFVIGDNRDASEDSRIYGAVPRESIFGRVRVICASFDPKSGLHFDRLTSIK